MRAAVTDDHQTRCLLCSVEPDSLIFSTQHAQALWASKAVTNGHLILVPLRHVSTWSALSEIEVDDVLRALTRAQALLAEDFGVTGFTIGFDENRAAGQASEHFHVHVIPRTFGDGPSGGSARSIALEGLEAAPLITVQAGDTPHEGCLISGGQDPLLQHLLPHLEKAKSADVTVAFVLTSGVRLLHSAFQDLLDRGGRLRIVAGDYLDVTDPLALRQLLDLSGDVQRWVFEASTLSFHPKSWILHLNNDRRIAIVGSSNLTETALRSGIEWNYRVYDSHAPNGLRDVAAGFEALLSRPEVHELTHDWIDRYEARRVRSISKPQSFAEVADEPPVPPPGPHEVQVQALLALKDTRAEGYTAGLVVLATGLGKTWLAAFDSKSFSRVLFVAHREEILAQATATFRRIRPNARLGRYTGQAKDLDAEVLFASIQTLGRATHLRNFSPDAFDYIVVDEFHHASAKTYRNLLDHFTPRFMLGLTATPERTDGGDLLGLCQENLVFRYDLIAGIDKGLLSPFHYFGIPDSVDYAQIPWRSSFFDEEELTAALATQERAKNAFEQWQKRRGKRTIGFCCSRNHADFMARYFVIHGVRAAAIHSGDTSAPRQASLEGLQAGDLDIVFAVDILNEGVDVPEIDTVLMLRPTQSSIVWLQQFGRGLRRSPGKEHLTVLDYIGNHRSFLTKARALLQVEEGERSLARALEAVERRELALPPGCEITYELEALNILKALLRPTRDADALEAFYRDFRERNRQRPSASEVFHAGFRPQSTGHESWYSFVRDMGDLSAEESRLVDEYSAFFEAVERGLMSKSYKMLLLQALLLEERLPGRVSIDDLTRVVIALASRNPRYAADISVPLSQFDAVKQLLVRNPIAAWTNEIRPNTPSHFAYSDSTFSASFEVDVEARPTFRDMVRELVDWRLLQYLDRTGSSDDPCDEPATAPKEVSLWREYAREDIPPLFGTTFNPGAWNSGIVRTGQNMILLVTLEKGNLFSGNEYADQFIDDQTFQWQSQTQTTMASTRGQIIRGLATGYKVHLFVRPTKLRGLRAAPFVYCGEPKFQSWTGERPITVVWKLPEPVPQHLHRLFGI